jgi:hypothetical protein
MNSMSNLRYILQPYGGPATRVKCPACGKQRKFSRYLDTQTGDLLPDQVGRCDREDNCGYHYTPKQLFEDTRPIGGVAITHHAAKASAAVRISSKAVQYLPLELLSQTMTGYERNNFTIFLESIFGKSLTRDLVARYFIGTSKHWAGSCIFWQIDAQGHVRQAKVMLYNPETGRRNKETGAFFAGKKILSDSDANLQQCFFGEHLIAENPEAKIGLAESEKTAIVASVYFPKLIWLATGGKNGCRWTDPGTCRVFRGREVVLFPDLGAYQDWAVKADQVKKAVNCKIMVSDLLEMIATEEQRIAGLDLADYLVVKDEKQGWALSEHGYPVMWDTKTVTA